MVRHGRARHGHHGRMHHHHHRAGHVGINHHHHHHGIRIGHNRTIHSGWSGGNVRVGNYRLGRPMRPAQGCGVVLLCFGVFLFFPGAVLTGTGNSSTFGGGVEAIIGPILLSISLVIIITAVVLVVLMCKKMKEQGDANVEQGTVVQGPGGAVAVVGAVPTGAQPAPYGIQPQAHPDGTQPQAATYGQPTSYGQPAPYGQPGPYNGNQQPPSGAPYGQPPPPMGAPPQGNMYGANFGTGYSQPGSQPSAPPRENPDLNAAPPPSYEQATGKY